MYKNLNNFAFIDSQNLNLGIQTMGWKLDFQRFFVYLQEKYGIAKAYLFIGYIPENQAMYTALQEYGYVLIFKPILRYNTGIVKGNIDAELVLQAMIDYQQYNKAIIISSDGDFYCLVDYLYKQNKLGLVLSPSKNKCSALLQKAAREKIKYIDNLKEKLELRK